MEIISVKNFICSNCGHKEYYHSGGVLKGEVAVESYISCEKCDKRYMASINPIEAESSEFVLPVNRCEAEPGSFITTCECGIISENSTDEVMQNQNKEHFIACKSCGKSKNITNMLKLN